MNTKVLFLLVVVLAASFIPESEAFTAGAGNIGRRGLVSEKTQIFVINSKILKFSKINFKIFD